MSTLPSSVDVAIIGAGAAGLGAANALKNSGLSVIVLEAQPTKEFVTSEQVAALALFLCGDDAAQITGTNLSIDGGWTAA